MRTHIAIGAVLLSAMLVGGVAFAQKEATINFPIPELGGCTSKDACKLYCSDQTHIEACVSFGESHGLMTSDEAARARTFATMEGPGGCVGEACRAYCDGPDHFSECAKFAEEHGLTAPKESISADENQNNPSKGGPHIDEEKAQTILAQKPGPGGCKTMDACRAFCSDSANMDVCFQFAKDNSLMSEDEIDRAKKFLDGTGPGGCRGEACKAYCDDTEHTDECLKFAEEKGMISKDEADQARKLSGKPGPGGCKGEECQTYCQDQSHRDECTSFAVENGFMTQAQADQMEHNMQTITGPGGCTGETCRTYCEDSAHLDECVLFANDHGMMGPHDNGQGEFNENNVNTGEINHLPPPDSENHRSMMGPGGCKNADECATFCKNNPDQCGGMNAGTRHGGSPAASGDHMPPCSSAEECRAMYEQNRGDQRVSNPPFNMTPEQQQMYQQYQESQPPSSVQSPPPGSIEPPSGSYYSPSPSPGSYSAPPPTNTPPPSSGPTSGASSANLVAAVFYIFSQFLHGF